MSVLLQVDFPYPGPWGAQMSEAMKGLAESIAHEPGLLWKIWTEDEANGEAGGIYLFVDRASADAYLHMHRARLLGFGIAHHGSHDGFEVRQRAQRALCEGRS